VALNSNYKEISSRCGSGERAQPLSIYLSIEQKRAGRPVGGNGAKGRGGATLRHSRAPEAGISRPRTTRGDTFLVPQSPRGARRFAPLSRGAVHGKKVFHWKRGRRGRECAPPVAAFLLFRLLLDKQHSVTAAQKGRTVRLRHRQRPRQRQRGEDAKEQKPIDREHRRGHDTADRVLIFDTQPKSLKRNCRLITST
jgi:hypothetical protein